MAVSANPAFQFLSGPQNQIAFIDAKEAAVLLKIHPRTLLRWAREGRIPAHPVAGSKRRTWRFVAAEIDCWAIAQVNSSDGDRCRNSRRK